MAGKDKSPFSVFGGKDDGDDPVSRTDRGGRDLSSFFSKVILKHDLQKASASSKAYPLYDSSGNIIGQMDPTTGKMILNGPISSAGPSSSSPSVSPLISKSSSKNRSADAFRALGAQETKDKELDERQEKIKKFLETMTEKEFKALDSLARDRLLINEEKIIKAHKKGIDTGFERLIELDLAKWDKFDNVIEIRLTPLGRRVYESLS